MNYDIIEITGNNINDLECLAKEAIVEGYNFIERTIDEWNSGINRFSKTGEFLLGVFHNDACIAIGGLTIDPYIDRKNVGRVRYLYVSKKFRKLGIAKNLLRIIISNAKSNFNVLRLFTNNSNAASLYESMGFRKSNNYKESHIIRNLK